MKELLKQLWNNDRIFNLVMSIFFLNFLFFANYSLIHSHERSHLQINKMFGCGGEIVVEFMSGYTTVEDCQLDNANTIAMNIAHSNVEDTYVDMTFYRFMIILGSIIMFQVIRIKRSVNRLIENKNG